ncbi:MAG: hypothetical protein ACT4NV_17005 [Rhodoferax sp.]
MKPVPLPPWIWRVLAAAVLALTFGLYTRGDFMLDLANQLWSCF